MTRMCALAFALASALGIAAAQDAELQDKVDKLIQALAADSKETRDKAVTDLIGVGRPALEALRKATQSKDPEVKSLAQQAIEKIGWGQGQDKLKQYVKERFEDGATSEPLKLKSIQSWFPNTKFYEVGQPAAAGGAMMGMESPRSVFAIRKHDPTLYRVFLRGILSENSLMDLIRKEKIQLREYDEAFDFCTTFLDLYWHSLSSRHVSWGGGAASRFQKIKGGWELQSPNYGSHFTFKTDAEGILVDVASSQGHYSYSPEYQRLTEEKTRLEVEKLKMEVEALKRQLDEARKK